MEDESPNKEMEVEITVKEFDINFKIQAVQAKGGWRGLLKLYHLIENPDGIPSYPVVLFESEAMESEKEAQMAALNELVKRLSS